MHRFFTCILTYPRAVLILLALPTVFFAYFLPNVELHTDVDNMLPASHPALVLSKQLEDEFSIRESMLIGVVYPSEESFYSPNTFRFLHRLSEELESLPSIQTGSIKGIFTVDDIVGTSEGFDVIPLLDQVPQSDEEILRFRQRVTHNPMLKGELVARDGSGTLVYVDPEPDADKASLYFQIKNVVVSEDNDHERKVFIAGHPVVAGLIGVYGDQDLRRMFPLVGFVVAGVLALLLKSLRGILLPLFVVLFSVVWTLGAMAVLGIPLFPITLVVPVVVMALGCADGIHILTRFYEAIDEQPISGKQQMILVAMDEMWVPVVLTSLTTSIGLLSLLSSSAEPLRYFGVFSALGVLVAMVLSLTFVPAVLVLLKMPRPRATPGHATTSLLQRISYAGHRLLPAWGKAIYIHGRLILAANLLMVVGAAASLPFLQVDNDPMRLFNPESEIPKANRVINEKFNGAGMLSVVLDAGRTDAFKSPRLLKRLERLEEMLQEEEDVGGCISLVDYLKLMNRAMHSDEPSWEILPQTDEEVAQYLLLYSMSGDTEDLDRVVDYTYQRANLIVRLKTFSSSRFGHLLRVIENLVQEWSQEEPVECKIGGRPLELHITADVLTKEQMYSICLSILGVFLATTLMFLSWSAALITILPISVACLWNFGIMSLFGLPLEPNSAITACIGIGVGIDYAIHFMSKYRYLTSRAVSEEFPDKDAFNVYKGLTIRTVETAGKAIIFNALVVILGFLVLLSSNFPPTRIMGMMITLNMFTCLVGSLTLLPAALNAIRPRSCRVPWVEDPVKSELKNPNE